MTKPVWRRWESEKAEELKSHFLYECIDSIHGLKQVCLDMIQFLSLCNLSFLVRGISERCGLLLACTKLLLKFSAEGTCKVIPYR